MLAQRLKASNWIPLDGCLVRSSSGRAVHGNPISACQRVSISAFPPFRPLSSDFCPLSSDFSFLLSAFALMNDVTVSQQFARCDRHFLHAGNHPERAKAAQAPAPLGKGGNYLLNVQAAEPVARLASATAKQECL